MGRCVLLASRSEFSASSCGVLAIDVSSQNAPCGAAVCVDETAALLGDRRRVCINPLPRARAPGVPPCADTTPELEMLPLRFEAKTTEELSDDQGKPNNEPAHRW